MRIAPIALVGLAACRGVLGIEDLALVDAPTIDASPFSPSGPHYHYVVSEMLVPTNNTQSRDFGLDLSGDGTVDNQLGLVVGTLAGQGFDIQGSVTVATLQGDTILLVDLQTPSFTTTTGAGLAVKFGTAPNPPACMDPNNVATCGQHLRGNGTFAIAANSPTYPALVGPVASGVFSSGPGNLGLQLALFAGPLTLDLIGARAKASGMTEQGMETLILAGAVTKTQFDTKVVPAIQAQFGPLIARDCPDPTQPPNCGCAAGSTGKTLLSLFDLQPPDCSVSVAEILNNSLIMALLAPDVTIDGKPALSLGVKAKLVRGELSF